MKILRYELVVSEQEVELDVEDLLLAYEKAKDREAFSKTADMLSEIPPVNPRTWMGENLLDVINIKIDELENFIRETIKTF